MDDNAPDDRIQAVVNHVLHAVDQRLEAVREQLLQVTTTIARSQAELSRRIDDCQRLCENLNVAEPAADSAAAAATGQLVHAANTLTERVQFLESRVNQYTNDRIAEVTALIERVGGVAPERAGVMTGVAQPAPAPTPAPMELPIDIALLSAQMSERLAAAVDRALGTMPANTRSN